MNLVKRVLGAIEVKGRRYVLLRDGFTVAYFLEEPDGTLIRVNRLPIESDASGDAA